MTNSRLCIGLDIDPQKIPKNYNVVDFAKHIIDETKEYAIAYKPNFAFFEAMEGGNEKLIEILSYLDSNAPNALKIADAKRGDIGSTMEKYVSAIYDTLGFDAMTIHPYLGREAVASALDRKDKAAIIVCRTSNPGSGEFQNMTDADGIPMWRRVAKNVTTEWNANGNCMLVMGATYPKELKEARAICGDDMFFLVPGVGAQGGTIKDVMENGGKNVIINASRSILESTDPKAEAARLTDEIRQYI